MGWSLVDTCTNSTGVCQAAGGPTQGWAGLWWCLRTVMSTQETGLAVGERRIRGAREGRAVNTT